jgi:hypothetical protein
LLFPVPLINQIQDCAEWADRLCRTDLIEGVIVSENDYTSNFTSAFRREINSRGIPGLKATIQVLNPSAERSLGADACIIFENDREFKASIFEAKWPRLSTHVNCWDSKQKLTGMSHFHDQLTRQHMQRQYTAVWEMFYLEHPFGRQPPYLPNEVSACVWHDNAFAASGVRPNLTEPWTDDDLTQLLKLHCLTIADVVGQICSCQRGIPMPLGLYQKAFGDASLPYNALVISGLPPTRVA